MKCLPKANCDLQITLPATLEAAEEFSSDFRRCARAVLPEKHRFTSELLVREALSNAVLHGCGRDPEKRIHCRLRLRGKHLIMVIQDDGEGFDWRAAWGNRSDSSAPSGRGIELLRTYASRIRFNDRGNTVTILKRCC